MRLTAYTCPVCKQRKSAHIDHTACKAELAKMAKKNTKHRAGCRSAQKYMEHLRICGAID